jgi:hypothetical protein
LSSHKDRAPLRAPWRRLRSGSANSI